MIKVARSFLNTDIQPTIPFLCTRVKEPDEDDKKKLIHLLQYLKATREITLTLKANQLKTPKWYVDAAFAVHHDMKSHTRGVVLFDKEQC